MKKYSPKIATFKYKTLQKHNTKLKKVILMKFLNNKKGIVTHPVTMFIIAFVLGLVAAYLLINYTAATGLFCPGA